MDADQVTQKTDTKEEHNMIGSTLAAFIALALAGTGLALLVWWLWRLWEGDEEETVAPPRTASIEIEAEAPPAEATVVVVEPEEPIEEVEAVPPDDLTRIEGIGPKTESALQKGGVSTYAQLAAADPDGIREILMASDPRLASRASPVSWSKQAALAAKGEWETLDALQSELKGGRLA
jgi:predicted flap endonuclease-1-like 5' DNA nuclease